MTTRAGKPPAGDGATLHELLEAARADCPEPLRHLLAAIVRTVQLHDERLIRIEETAEIRDVLP